MSEGRPRTGLGADVRDLRLAHALLRLCLGVNILVHGVSRLGDMRGFVDGASRGFEATFLPMPLVRAFLWTVSPLETLIGALLVLGLFLRPALVAGLLLMAALIFGTTLKQDWGTAGSQMIYSLVYFVLLALARQDAWSVDAARR